MSIRRRSVWAGGLVCLVGGLVVMACSAEGADVGQPQGLCDDTCPSALNGVCEDGGLNSMAAICALGTDCSDCGPREDPNAGGVGGGGGMATGGSAAMPTGGTAAVGTGGTAAVATGGTGNVVTLTGGSGGVVTPTGGTGAGTATGGTSGGGTTGGDGSSGIIPADGGNFIKDWDQSGALGAWYLYQDEGGSSIVSAFPDPTGNSDIGSSNGEMCFSGTAAGHHDSDYGTNWGAGVGFNVCAIPNETDWLPGDLANQTPGTIYSAGSCPTILSGVNSISFTISGSWTGLDLRLGFQQDEADDVSPFVSVTSAGTYTYNASDGSVPDSWEVNNPGDVGTPDVLAIQFQIASDSDDATFEFCLSNITIQ